MPLTGTYAPVRDDRARQQAELYEATGGAEGRHTAGVPVVILTTLGAKTGNLRKHPVMRVHADGEYAVVASKGGSEENPTWFNNIVDHPLVELQDGAVKRDYTARLVEGDEKATWWERAVAVWPHYDEYQEKTDRQIPVFVLTPVDVAA